MISLANIFGKKTEDTVLWIDLWGISKLIQDHQSTGDLLIQSDIAFKIAIFTSRLAVVAQNFSDIDVLQGSDGAFVVGADPNRVFEVAINIFQNLHLHFGTRFHLVPLRGGISQNLIETSSNKEELEKLKNFRYFPYTGEGMAKASKIERNQNKKGIRLFITETVKVRLNTNNIQRVSNLPEPNGVKILSEQTENYFEVNWMDKTFLDHQIGHKSVKEYLEEIYNASQNSSDIHLKGLGEGLKELIDQI